MQYSLHDMIELAGEYIAAGQMLNIPHLDAIGQALFQECNKIIDEHGGHVMHGFGTYHTTFPDSENGDGGPIFYEQALQLYEILNPQNEDHAKEIMKDVHKALRAELQVQYPSSQDIYVERKEPLLRIEELVGKN